MNKYRKKPLVIDAVQYTNTNFQEIIRICYEKLLLESPFRNTLIVKTLEGDMKLNIGDWLIRGIKGEFYPIKNDIFLESYEAVNE